ncbi:unnamed protein product, partial [Hapterophycus canaliculatus]
MVLRLHEDRRIRQEIVRAGLAAHGARPLRPGTGSKLGGGKTRRRSCSQGDNSPSAATTPGTSHRTFAEHGENTQQQNREWHERE